MPYVLWDESLDVGVEAFNDDHRRLVGFINELHSGLVSGLGIAKMSHILEGLADYTEKHFGREEKMMQQYGYPDYEKHRSAHQNLLAQVAEFNARLQSGEKTFSLELMAFLKDWLINHIKGTDMGYRDFFKGKGVG